MVIFTPSGDRAGRKGELTHMNEENEIKRIIELTRKRFPDMSEKSLEIGARLAFRAFENVPCYSTAEIIKMASKQRARSEYTAQRHEEMAIEMAVLVKLCRLKREYASLVLSYAHWSDYAPDSITDFYKRHLPNEYRNLTALNSWLGNNYKDLIGYKICLISKIDRFTQLIKKLPKSEISKLFADIPDYPLINS